MTLGASTSGREQAARLADYLSLVETRPHWFAGPADGVQVATRVPDILNIEAVMAARYVERGMPPEWAQVGIRYQDPYLMVLVDAVTFPDGSPGVHHRVVRPAGDNSGVAILPMLDGKIVLIRHFRHPLRAWTWEAPRGAIETGSDAPATVANELREEIEAAVNEIVPIGRMYGATGFMGLTVLLYLARLRSVGRPALGEGISEIRLVSVAEMEAMIRDCEIVDSFTLGAFLHARLRALI